MSKGLEALKDIRELFTCHDIDLLEKCSVIEQELKEYEGAKNHIEALHKERVENSLKIKALEIIKESQLNVGNVIHDIKEHGLTYQDYLDSYDYYQYGGTQLTQEEYDLLKEVLL